MLRGGLCTMARNTNKLKGTSINTFFGRITALHGTRNLTVYRILSRLLRSVRLWRMNNALKRMYSTDTPFTGVTASQTMHL